MKRFFGVLCLLLVQKMVPAQIRLPVYSDSLFSTYYHQRVSLFKTLPKTKGDIIFLGNSITDGAEWSELFNDWRMKNRGISGDVTAGILHRLDEIAKGRPAKIFLLIGTNDLARGATADSVVKNILLIMAYLRQETPVTKLYVQSILPVNEAFGKFAGHMSQGEQIKKVNAQLARNAAAYHYTYIDLYTLFSDENGKLKKEVTNDGLHLTGAGYRLWKQGLYSYIVR